MTVKTVPDPCNNTVDEVTTYIRCHLIHIVTMLTVSTSFKVESKNVWHAHIIHFAFETMSLSSSFENKCCDHGGIPCVPHGSNLDEMPADMRCHLIGMGTMRKLLTSAKS